MRYQRRALCTLAVAVSASFFGAAALRAGQAEGEKGKRPSLSLKLSPLLAAAPAKVRAVVEVRGGANDYEDFYCPTLEWDWGDDTRSEATQDCEPYEAGRSEIRRRFTADHTFQHGGNYKVMFRMKRKDKIVIATSANIQVRPGLSDEF